MQRVYQAANNIEAHMIVHLLEQAGVQAHVQGEHLQSGAGELPLGNLVAVAVADDDVATAREIIRDWEKRVAPSASDSTSAPAKPNAWGYGVAFMIGALLAGGFAWSIYTGPESTDILDRNDDGKADDWAIYNGGRLERVDTDRNFDGRIDAVAEYDASGTLTRYRSDDNFDGGMETTTLYRHGLPDEMGSDFDGDGKVDYRVLFENGVANVAEYLDPATDKVKKKITYVAGKTDRAYIDQDGDGTWDRSYRFDAIDEPVFEP